ncbi:MAG: DEAD/DEAH box helicase, partial [Trueperaceae bacterium]
MSFASFDFDARVTAGIAAARYETPTPIQRDAIPEVLRGRDVLGLAQTGTGKTAAFVLPMLQRLLDGPRGKVRGLIVAPTRELAEQIHGEITTLGQKTGIRSATVYGGVGKNPQLRALRGRADVIVACPGRLLDHMREGDADLSRVEVLVLDEADHMFDMGFLPDVRAIVKAVPKDAQRLLFSATMPAEIRHLADAILSDPFTVEIARSRPADTVAHAMYPTGTERKTDLLRKLLDDVGAGSTLVFTRTKHRAKRLAQQLNRDGFDVAALQGNMSQNARQRALDDFRQGKIQILVATDIAARGIDVSRVSHVMNYDIPDTSDAYTHRLGRTGRAERSGDAYTLLTREDGKQLRQIEQALGARVDRVVVDGYGAEEVPENLASGRVAPRPGGRGGSGGSGGAIASVPSGG